ncbi:MAG: hypothetical protein V7K88_12990 [Nostoc sp.]|uniref:hypothetical protein n=1 Tax=Nostoc sp. TaxID=1180 RepID=UPI002FF6A614
MAKDIVEEKNIFSKSFLILASFVFIIPMFLLSFKIFQFKRLILVLLEFYTKSLTDRLIVIYTRLKSASNLNIANNRQHRFWLIKTIEDCKNFSNTFNSIASYKYIFPLFSGLTALLPVIIKNTFVSDFLKNFIKSPPHLNHIFVQLFVLLFLYLPTLIIILIFINCYLVMIYILNKFEVFDYENELYKKLENRVNIKRLDMNAGDQLYIRLFFLLQIFFIVSSLVFFIPHLLDISFTIKIPLIFIILGLALACYVFSWLNKKNK